MKIMLGDDEDEAVPTSENFSLPRITRNDNSMDFIPLSPTRNHSRTASVTTSRSRASRLVRDDSAVENVTSSIAVIPKDDLPLLPTQNRSRTGSFATSRSKASPPYRFVRSRSQPENLAAMGGSLEKLESYERGLSNIRGSGSLHGHHLGQPSKMTKDDWGVAYHPGRLQKHSRTASAATSRSRSRSRSHASKAKSTSPTYRFVRSQSQPEHTGGSLNDQQDDYYQQEDYYTSERKLSISGDHWNDGVEDVNDSTWLPSSIANIMVPTSSGKLKQRAESPISFEVALHYPIVANGSRISASLDSLRFAPETEEKSCFDCFQFRNGQMSPLDCSQYLAKIKQDDQALGAASSFSDRGSNHESSYIARMLLLDFDGSRNDHFKQITREDFVKLINANRISSEFIEVLSNRSGAIIHESSESDIKVPGTQLSVVWKSPKNPFTDSSVFFQYNHHSHSTKAFVCANQELLQKIRERLQEIFAQPMTRAGNTNTHPVIFLSTIVSEHGAKLDFYRQRLTKDVRDNESKTGIGCYESNPKDILQTPALGQLMNDLYQLDGLIRMLCQAYVFELDLLLKIEELFEAFTKLHTDKTDSKGYNEFSGDATLIGRSLALTTSLLKNGLNQAKLLQQQTEIQLDVVRTKLAKYDSETSVSIAKETREDSNAMKTVAGLTLIFLPATFAASLFSTIFFDRPSRGTHSDAQAESSDNTQDSRLELLPDSWLYLAVTIPLTLFVMTVWYCWLRWDVRKRNKTTEEEGANHDRGIGRGLDLERGLDGGWRSFRSELDDRRSTPVTP